jgi:hypothetical protein
MSPREVGDFLCNVTVISSLCENVSNGALADFGFGLVCNLGEGFSSLGEQLSDNGMFHTICCLLWTAAVREIFSGFGFFPLRPYVLCCGLVNAILPTSLTHWCPCDNCSNELVLCCFINLDP